MLLPPVERRGEIHFYLAKSLPYGTRLAISFALMATGFSIQILLGGGLAVVGLAFVFAGVLMLLTKGFENKVAQRRGKHEWRPSRREEIQRIIDINAKQKKWDQAAVDITNSRGLAVLVGLTVLCGLAFLVLGRPQPGSVRGGTSLLFFNVPVMLLPFWFTGVRSILKNDRLVVKAEMLLKVEEALDVFGKESGEEFQYQLQTAEARDGSGEVPQDVKAILLFHEGSPDFLGLQMQVSINSVQGKDFPYFYCVLVARPAFGGLSVERPRRARRKWWQALGAGASGRQDVVVENNRENDVDIAVIRQRTTQKTGYHTNPAAAIALFAFALKEARRLIANAP